MFGSRDSWGRGNATGSGVFSSIKTGGDFMKRSVLFVLLCAALAAGAFVLGRGTARAGGHVIPSAGTPEGKTQYWEYQSQLFYDSDAYTCVKRHRACEMLHARTRHESDWEVVMQKQIMKQTLLLSLIPLTLLIILAASIIHSCEKTTRPTTRTMWSTAVKYLHCPAAQSS